MLRSSKHHLPGTPLYGQVPFGLLNTGRLLGSNPPESAKARNGLLHSCHVYGLLAKSPRSRRWRATRLGRIAMARLSN